MGRQWLHAKREVAGLRKGLVTGKLVKEISVAAKLGGADPNANARLFAAIEKARKASVSRDVIERAIKKGAGIGGEKLVMEHVGFEGYAPHKVPTGPTCCTSSRRWKTMTTSIASGLRSSRNEANTAIVSRIRQWRPRAKATPASASLIAAFTCSSARSRWPPLFRSARSSEARAARRWLIASCMFAWSARTGVAIASRITRAMVNL